MSDPHHDPTAATSRNSRIGLILFFVYVIIYGLFVYLSAFHADVMAKRPLFDVNLAVLYGLGLIVIALVLALVYMFICRGGNDRPEGRP